MRIGVLGSGTVGTTLGAGFAAAGHEVRLGSGSPDRADVQDWVASTGHGVGAAPFAAVAAWAETVVLAVKGEVVVGLLTEIGAEAFTGKVVIDATNPIDTSSGRPRLAFGFTDSLGEQVQRTLPQAHVVKAFNTVGAPLMVHPKLAGGVRPTMFIAGDDPAAKALVTDLLAGFGWEADDQGGIEAARLLEPLCFVWVNHGLRTGSWDHAFAFVRQAS
jgi:predicted dinucleotide-binding enzyme